MAATPNEAGAKPLQLVPVLSLALALRVLAMMLLFRAAPQDWFYNQASELNCLARSILSGHGFSSPFGGSTGPSAFLAPGYPLLVALVYRCFGICGLRSAIVLTGAQVLFGVLTVLMAMLVAKRLFGVRTAHLAGVLCAISPTMVWLPSLFWETSLSTLLLIGALRLALRCSDYPAATNWMILGGYCGLAMLFNPAVALTFAGVGVWAAYSSRSVSGHMSRSAPWLAPVACVLVFAAWPIRNAVVLHAFVPLRSNLGYELWQGNRPGSRGFFTHELYLNENRAEFNSYAAIGELPYVRNKSANALATIKANPLRFVRLSLRRAGAFWTAFGGNGISRIVIGEIVLTSVLGLAGLVLLLARHRDHAGLFLAPFLLFPLPYYFTHPDFRFRLVLEPVALVLVAAFSKERRII